MDAADFGHPCAGADLQPHDNHTAAEFPHQEGVAMTDRSLFPLQFFQQLNDLRLYRRIERTRCLVADQKRRLHSKSPRNCGSLALSAARLAGIAHRRFRTKFHFFQQLRQMKTRLFPAHSLIPKSFQNPGFERLHWIEGILRGLEDHLYFPVNFALPPAFSSEDFLAFQQNAACTR